MSWLENVLTYVYLIFMCVFSFDIVRRHDSGLEEEEEEEECNEITY